MSSEKADPAELQAIVSLLRQALISANGVTHCVDSFCVGASTWATKAGRELFESVMAKARHGKLYIHQLEELSPEASRMASWAASQTSNVGLQEAFVGLVWSYRLRCVKTQQKALQAAIEAKDLDQANAIVRAMADIGQAGGGEIRDLSEVAREVVAEIRAGKQRIVPTGIPAVDRGIGGLPLNLCVIAAQPGVGKSGFLASLALSMAAQGKRVGILSLEDEGSWLVRRILARSNSMSVAEVMGAHGKPLALERLDRSVDEMKEHFGGYISVQDMSRPNVSQVVGAIERLVSSKKVDVVFIDHIGEIVLEKGHRHDLEIDGALSDIRNICRRLGIPIVVLSHTKRAEGGETPKLTDFAFSAGLERKSRLALILTREGSGRELGVHVVKNTEGPSGQSFTLQFDKQSGMVI